MQDKENKKKRIMVPSESTHDSESFYTKLTDLLDSSSGLSLIFNVRETLLDLYLFYLEVTRRGGFHQVGRDEKWGEVVSALKLEGSNAKLSAQVEILYAHLLYEFEQMYFFQCPAKQPSTIGLLKKKWCPAASLSKLMDMEDGHRVTMCKDCSPQMTAEAGYVEQPVLLPAPSNEKEKKKRREAGYVVQPVLLPAPSNEKEKKKRREAGYLVQPVLLPAPSNEKEKKKRGGAPARQRNAYNIFLKQECARLRACSETLDGTSIRRMATDAWKHMSEIEKQPYVEESKKNKEKSKEQANEAMITNNKQQSLGDLKEESRPSSCGDYCVPSQPEADNSVFSAELGLTLKMTGKVPKESLEEWDTYLSL